VTHAVIYVLLKFWIIRINIWRTEGLTTSCSNNFR